MNTNLVEKLMHKKDMYISDTKEQDIVRTCEHERLYLQRIRNGDVEGILLRREQGERAPQPIRLVGDPHKCMEYRVCASIALATYAAIEGGLDPASAYALNDLYLQRLELCKDAAEMGQLYHEMELLFARQVRQVREVRSGASYVEKCKLFIDQHLSKLFTLDDIAAALNINKSYLSRRFAQETGMRIMEYTRKKRIEAAANMLKYTDKTISAISASFCFPTQSHFGALFKQLIGTTPLKYRTANQIIEVRPDE